MESENVGSRSVGNQSHFSRSRLFCLTMLPFAASGAMLQRVGIERHIRGVD